MALNEYNKKRDFSKTGEPKGAKYHISRMRFVVQEHEATHHHFDFRLELPEDIFENPHDPRGYIVLKSWAIPKYVPDKKGEKKLAVATEDHPVEYCDFEGTIPEGEYGAGIVKIWDKGSFEIISNEAKTLKVRLKGNKLNGDWVLINTRFSKENQWLIFRA
ncbi:TPA: 3'-phosphoesterase [candidate division CPR2 bacterium]|uniref:DNA ligase D 3'-phosphoesterase domain-containing protein n=1 Tax=candidate division CPR2 bacterium GW2011_GWC1_41_48 TaxID=1618344 RepID=A0A0G0WC60_UNCC2|nr:MAG: hypothetical protein UT47_C0001G0037 [candidate division CPR2 bacterium GW2011_GWC2_39_35]KKR29477.1 MAG: hypothetical protein UT60_C0001G0013 [candidate division CPR2 bacterium GW2011_GWD2_39_7]KKR29702.1 MAG: hypothetical protein UT59_C0001G0011 [candidate division CPR2 bacterium GW2011_GWD1_39_7]KKS09632.1 MAG: hypothetical protein UU65_C0001G0037 [candidate division CPR2 bacterium GW2011_GWC1_41_48]OGB59487.1 MAG: hypothetical protein A2Y27_00845 [candidate division CPR2 bacterium G